MRDADGRTVRRPTAPRDARGEAIAPRVLLAPHGRGWRAQTPRVYVWQETAAEAAGWVAALVPARR
jgi:hypothetical protein